MASPHFSVLMSEVLEVFNGQQLEYFLDGTLGAGGHSFAILQAHPELKTLYGIDQDPEALGIASKKLAPFKDKIQLIPSNFTQFPKHQLPPLDGILVDLGVSSMQLDQPEKGFSFMKDGPLDMRMDPTNPLTAEIIVNTWEEWDLARIFRDYGEEERWKLAARKLVEARKVEPITTTRQLVSVLEAPLTKRYKPGAIHPLTLVFQALRIAVNRELDVIETFLPAALKALKPGGRLAVISFHSLEDRIVKNFFRHAADDKESTSGIGGIFLDKIPEVRILSRKPITPTEQEAREHPRSRSAKLRAVEKLG